MVVYLLTPRNKKMIEKCDVYLPSTTFSGMKAYRFFMIYQIVGDMVIVIIKIRER